MTAFPFSLGQRPGDRVRRRLLLALVVGLLALPFAAFVGISLYSQVRLARAQASFVRAFGPDEFRDIGQRVDPRRPSIGHELVAAAEGINLSELQSGRLVAHATGRYRLLHRTITPLRSRCTEGLERMEAAIATPGVEWSPTPAARDRWADPDRKQAGPLASLAPACPDPDRKQAGPLASLAPACPDPDRKQAGPLASLAPAWPESAAAAARSVHACGLDAIQRGDREAAIDAATVLGVLAQDLQSKPVRLGLMIGRHAEGRQRDLIDRLGVASLSPAQAARLLAGLPAAAVSTPRRHLIAGEALNILRFHDKEKEPIDRLAGAAYLHQLARMVSGDRRAAGWLDRLLVRDGELESHLKKEQARMEDHLRRREEMRRALTLAAR
jgi:hypothetical protein